VGVRGSVRVGVVLGVPLPLGDREGVALQLGDRVGVGVAELERLDVAVLVGLLLLVTLFDWLRDSVLLAVAVAV